MAALDQLKRAPKWAWYTVGGVALGAGAIRVWNNRATDDTPANAPADDGSALPGSPSYQSPGGGAPGVIVPPVIIPTGDTNDPGLGALSELYVGAVSQLMGEWEQVYGPIAGMIPALVPTPDEYMALVQSGAEIARETPIVSVPPVPQPAPAPAPAPGAADRVVKRCRRSYNGKSNNCRVEVTDVYASGRRKIVSDTKVSEKPCGDPHTECHKV